MIKIGTILGMSGSFAIIGIVIFPLDVEFIPYSFFADLFFLSSSTAILCSSLMVYDYPKAPNGSNMLVFICLIIGGITVLLIIDPFTIYGPLLQKGVVFGYFT